MKRLNSIYKLHLVTITTIMIMTYGKRGKRCEEEVEKHEVHLVDHHLTGETTVQLEPLKKTNIFLTTMKDSAEIWNFRKLEL